MTNNRKLQFTWKKFWEVIFRHKMKIVIVPTLIFVLGTALIIYAPRAYRSEAQLFLRIGRESVGIDPTATAGQTVSLQQSGRKDEIKSTIQVLRSRGIISQVVDRLGPDVVLGRSDDQASTSSATFDVVAKPLNYMISQLKRLDPISDREAAIIAVERNLNAESERESMLIVVRYTAKSPKLAQLVCAALVDVHRQEHMRMYRNQSSPQFFVEQQARLRVDLDDSLQALRDTKNAMGLADLEARRATLESQFSAIQLQRLSTEQQLADAAAHITELDGQLAKMPERLVASQKSVPNAGADMLRDQLYALEVKSLDLEARFSDSHPLVQAAKEQLKEARHVLAEQADQRTETTDNVNPVYRQLLLEVTHEKGIVAGLKARQSQLEDQERIVLVNLRAVNDGELRLDQLDRAVALARDKYLQYSRSIEESVIDRELERENISNLCEVQPATLAERPVSPSKPLIALGTLFFACAGTAALVFGCEQLDARLRTEEDVEGALGLPVLGAIPSSHASRGMLPARRAARTHVAAVHQPSA